MALEDLASEPRDVVGRHPDAREEETKGGEEVGEIVVERGRSWEEALAGLEERQGGTRRWSWRADGEKARAEGARCLLSFDPHAHTPLLSSTPALSSPRSFKAIIGIRAACTPA